jgi:hypothetical protein
MSTAQSRGEEATVGYEIFVEHPETLSRRAQDFASWSLWAGVGISDQAKLIQTLCGPQAVEWDRQICQILDTGGLLSVPGVEKVWKGAGSVMTEKVREVFSFAREHRYPVRVVFSKGFGSLSASAYLAKQGSA